MSSIIYRPVSILCSTSKVFEKILFDVLYLHVKRKISPRQHDFSQKEVCNNSDAGFLYAAYDHFVSPQYKEPGSLNRIRSFGRKVEASRCFRISNRSFKKLLNIESNIE